MISNAKRKPLSRRRLQLTLLSLPFVVLIFLFSYVPLMGWALAFFNYKPGMDLGRLRFEGLKYFKLIFEYWPDTRNALVNTLALSGLNYLFSFAPVVLALMLNEVRSSWYKRSIQSIVTLPNFVSWVIVYSMCFSIFSWDGLLNGILGNLGLIQKPTQILSNARIAWIVQSLLSQWKSIGWSAIIYLAAISGIDPQLYDAAMVDGAGRFRCIWHITIPGVMPTFIVLFILSMGHILSVGFDQYYVFNNPMVATRLEVLDLYTYRLGIGSQDYSFATAVGILKSVVSIVSIFLVNALAKQVRGENVI